MDLELEYADSVTIVTYPTASLDMNGVQDFREAMKEILQSGSHVIFDMSKLSFIDSQGLGALMFCHQYVKSKDAILVFCGLTKTVDSLIGLVRMHKVFDIYKTKEEALKSLQS